jgi:predicted amidohydrolase
LSKRDPISQAQKLEEKIKEMQRRQRNYIEKAEKEIGNYLMKEWGVEDIQQAKKIIKELKPNVDNMFNYQSKDELKHEVLNENNG